MTQAMGGKIQLTPDPKLDLTFERLVDVRPELVWMAWTTPSHLMKWFTPKPWKTVECEIDLRPGGRFYTVMESPEGQRFPNVGSYLEVLPNERLIWTNALLPGYRPIYPPGACPGEAFSFPGVISLEPATVNGAKGTKYTALVIHADEAGRNHHAARGFAEGWGAAFDQLVESVRGM